MNYLSRIFIISIIISFSLNVFSQNRLIGVIEAYPESEIVVSHNQQLMDDNVKDTVNITIPQIRIEAFYVRQCGEPGIYYLKTLFR